MKTSLKNNSLVLLVSVLLMWSFSTGGRLDLRAQGVAGAGGGAGTASAASQLSQPVPLTGDFVVRNLEADSSLGASYPRVIQLKTYAPGKGQLLASYGRRGAMPIYRSTDNGETFQFFSEIQGLRGQPTLYELPVKMGEFSAGTILAAAGQESTDPNKRMLGCYYSSDGGKIWQFLSTFAVGGPGRYDPNDRAGISLQQNPVFEPYLYADAAGRLVVYFSDERDKKNGYSQLLDHRVSNDGGPDVGRFGL
jgi:hypothetical protein